MLQSNTDSSLFQLQAPPRPKSKKRPQNPPPLVAPPSNTSSSALSHKSFGSAAGPDSTSLHSCFEDDEDEEALTPRASLINIAAPFANEDAFTELSASPTLGARSSTHSTSSAASAKTSSSVSRLMAAMSFPASPRRSVSADPVHSPSATMTVLLTDRSPTPSSPLLPRRTLMRSLSSTCVSASPTSPSSGGSLRKRLGWRGIHSAQRDAETAIAMSPRSPLTPRRAEALHTPPAASIAAVLQGDEEAEPLSATLKALGAKRRTLRFGASAVVPVNDDETDDQVDALRGDDVKSACSEPAWTPNLQHEEFELVTATRTIFHLPTWVRFEANHHARMRVAHDNRQAALEYAQLRKATVPQVPQQGKVALPKMSQLGDAAPSSPNGELLAGFDLDAPSPPQPQEAEQDNDEVRSEAAYKVSVVRRPTLAAMREMDARSEGKRNLVEKVRSAWPPFRPQRRIKAQCEYPRKALLLARSPCTTNNNNENTAVEQDRRDGWGGVLTRTSWFPSQGKGPLVSPGASASKRGLQTMLLQPSTRAKTSMESDEWEDVGEPSGEAGAEERSFLEMHDTPRFLNRPPVQRRRWLPSLFTARRPHGDDSSSWQSVPLKRMRSASVPVSPASQEVASQLISKGTKSVENRPLQTHASKRTRAAVVAITLLLVFAVVANIVIIARAHDAPRQQHRSGNATVNGAIDPLVGRLGSITVSSEQARQSTIAKAAQLSQP